ncbi:MAG TPA: ATP-binding protein [Microbacterium sp.]|uniref:ATP-binding protein n=1 Tax=Microbacterium sp. TaxID=51671 RepID=UPI002CFA6502|nr:ATP-binding protein [Microbacterium sp.]HWI31162.1 ATP-binding protein [Microbacterium sp.]
MVNELSIGTLLESEDATPSHVLAAKLNRHTFWCGQSGSGKTYALGVLLEQVLLQTRLPLVILDPNSDFVRLGEIRDDAPADAAAQLAARDIRVFRSSAEDGAPLHVKFLGMPVRSRAAILQVDPLYDAEDYNVMLQLEHELGAFRGASVPDVAFDHTKLLAYLRSSDDPARHRLAMRLENLGVADWRLWAWGHRSVIDDIDERPDATVVDLGGFATPAESRAAALAVLDHLWEHRDDRIGRLIVIDEAHNLCTPTPSSPVEKLLTERIVQIAAEGRKYGLWLLLSTQRPSKVHPNALSQCDNLALMRMSSPRDLAELGEVFGYAPESLLERSPGFAQGQALFAGGFVDQASLVQMGSRLTHEGGSDVRVPLR